MEATVNIRDVLSHVALKTNVLNFIWLGKTSMTFNSHTEFDVFEAALQESSVITHKTLPLIFCQLILREHVHITNL